MADRASRAAAIALVAGLALGALAGCSEPTSGVSNVSRAEPTTTGPREGPHMPSVLGKQLDDAIRTLEALEAKPEVSDATSDGRVQLVTSRWKVCSQLPAPGAPLKNETPHLFVVKNSENCPAP